MPGKAITFYLKKIFKLLLNIKPIPLLTFASFIVYHHNQFRPTHSTPMPLKSIKWKKNYYRYWMTSIPENLGLLVGVKNAYIIYGLAILISFIF